jgi:hypothetical protein
VGIIRQEEEEEEEEEEEKIYECNKYLLEKL